MMLKHLVAQPLQLVDAHRIQKPNVTRTLLVVSGQQDKVVDVNKNTNHK